MAKKINIFLGSYTYMYMASCTEFRNDTKNNNNFFLFEVVISRGSGVTTDVFHDVPLLSDEPSLSADVLNLLQAAGIVYY